MNPTESAQSAVKDLYRDLILDHARNPRHFGHLEGATHHCEGINPLCGDKIGVQLRVGGDDTITDGAFEGSGCAISIASASLMTDTVIGRATADARAIADSVTRGLQSGFQASPESDVQKLKALEGVREFPSRIKCATLAWQTLCGALQGQTKPISTE